MNISQPKHHRQPALEQLVFDPWGPRDEAWLATRLRVRKTALQVVLAAISSLFLLFIVAYVIRAQYDDWVSLTAPWQPLAQPWLLWFNSALLLLSSFAMQGAKHWYQCGLDHYTRQLLLLAGLFALLFLASQLWLLSQLHATGYRFNSNPANSFFYLLTGLHGLHLSAGLMVLALAIWRSFQQVSSALLSTSVALCTLYWHYLLALWLLLLTVLTSKHETLLAIAEFCGL